MSSLKIGIAGYMGAGKSFGARFLANNENEIINADSIAKDLMNGDDSIKKNLLNQFGNDIFVKGNPKGSLLFSILGKKAFQSLTNLVSLNQIVHPLLIEQLQEIMVSTEQAQCILDAALISYWHLEDWFDFLFWIQCPADIRLQRLLNRVTLSRKELERRMTLQHSLIEEPRGKRWIIISNKDSPNRFEKRIKLAMVKLKETTQLS